MYYENQSHVKSTTQNTQTGMSLEGSFPKLLAPIVLLLFKHLLNILDSSNVKIYLEENCRIVLYYRNKVIIQVKIVLTV